MKVTLIGEVQSKPLLRTLTRIANQMLEGLMGPSGDEVAAEWSWGPAGPDMLLHLTLRDAHGAAEGRFKLEEFVDLDPLGSRLADVWGLLLEKGPKSAVGRIRDWTGSKTASRQAPQFPFATAGTTTAGGCAAAAAVAETVFRVAVGPEGVHLSTAANPFPAGAADGKRLIRLTVSGGKRGVKPPSWNMTAAAYANWRDMLTWSGYQLDERPE